MTPPDFTDVPAHVMVPVTLALIGVGVALIEVIVALFGWVRRAPRDPAQRLLRAAEARVKFAEWCSDDHAARAMMAHWTSDDSSLVGDYRTPHQTPPPPPPIPWRLRFACFFGLHLQSWPHGGFNRWGLPMYLEAGRATFGHCLVCGECAGRPCPDCEHDAWRGARRARHAPPAESPDSRNGTESA